MATVDLHLHSTASDGECAPAEVVARAAATGLSAIALTDHDTIDGFGEAADAGSVVGLRVVGGCEFSVKAPWGEMHLLGYFLPTADGTLNAFLAEQRAKRTERARRIVHRLTRVGVPLTVEDVLKQAGGAAIGRPHVARALIARGFVRDIGVAFDRYLGWGRPAFVPKELPAVADVAALVRGRGGVTSAAHLRDRATRGFLKNLRDAGVDAVEVLHPAHDESTAQKVGALADEVGLLPTGGSDWHGDGLERADRATLGELVAPSAWLDALTGLHQDRVSRQEASR